MGRKVIICTYILILGVICHITIDDLSRLFVVDRNGRIVFSVIELQHLI